MSCKRTCQYYKKGSTVPGKRNSKKAKIARKKKNKYQKKLNSTPKEKKRRAELNRLNRKMGSVKGDGKDVSHQKDGSVRLENASKNRGSKSNTAGDKRSRGKGRKMQEGGAVSAYANLRKNFWTKKVLDKNTSVTLQGSPRVESMGLESQEVIPLDTDSLLFNSGEMLNTPIPLQVEENTPKIVRDNTTKAAPVTPQIDFNTAFRQARETLGPGKIFEFNGKKYSTDYKPNIPKNTTNQPTYIPQQPNRQVKSSSNPGQPISEYPWNKAVKSSPFLTSNIDDLINEDGNIDLGVMVVKGTKKGSKSNNTENTPWLKPTATGPITTGSINDLVNEEGNIQLPPTVVKGTARGNSMSPEARNAFGITPEVVKSQDLSINPLTGKQYVHDDNLPKRKSNKLGDLLSKPISRKKINSDIKDSRNKTLQTIDNVKEPLKVGALATYSEVEQKIDNTYVDTPEVQINTVRGEENFKNSTKTREALTPQVEKQLEEVKRKGGFDKNFMILDKKNGKAFYFSPNGTPLNYETIATGTQVEDTSHSIGMRSFYKDDANKGKSHEDYFKFLEDSKGKVTPAGVFTIGQKRENVNENQARFPMLTVLADIANFDAIGTRASKIKEQRTRDYGKDGWLNTLIDRNGLASDKALHGTNNQERIQAKAEYDRTGDASKLKLTNGCINFFGKSICPDMTEKGSKVIILPEETDEVYDDFNQKNVFGARTIKDYKSKVYSTLSEKGLDVPKEALDFITAVAAKESELGLSQLKKIEDAVPDQVNPFASRGDFQINPEPFADYLPEDYDESLGSQAEAVLNFYNANKDKYSVAEMYKIYNSGNPNNAERNKKVKQFMRQFNKIKTID